MHLLKRNIHTKVHDSIIWHLHQYHQTIIGKHDDEKFYIFNHCCSALASSLRLVASVYKHHSFKEEREWRHVFRFPTSDEVKHRKRGNQNVPYVEISFPLKSLNKIYISPGSKQKNAEETILKRLTELELNKKIEILLSDSPYNWS